MKTPIVILPGWKLPASRYSTLVSLFKKEGYPAFALDLPGFSNKPLNADVVTLNDYVAFVDKFMKLHKFSHAIFIGHSFGGRLAIKYAYTYPQKVTKLILTGVPVIRHVSFKKKAASYVAFLGKTATGLFPVSVYEFFRKVLYFILGEWDYYKSGKMKTVFVNVINEDLVEYIKNLSMPIFLIWGEKDTFTPATDVEKIKNLRENIQTIIVPNATHRLPMESPNIFITQCKFFL